MLQSNNCRITEVHVKINNTESLENLLEAFRGVLFTMGYHPDLIDSHVSLLGEFTGENEDFGYDNGNN